VHVNAYQIKDKHVYVYQIENRKFMKKLYAKRKMICINFPNPEKKYQKILLVF